MFDHFFKRHKEPQAVREWQSSPLGQAVTAHLDAFLTDYVHVAGMEEKNQEGLIIELYGSIEAVLEAEKPRIKLREALAKLVLDFAELRILCLTEQQKLETPYANCPYISGELHRCVERAVPHVAFLREAKGRQPELSNEELLQMCNRGSGRILFNMKLLNCVRLEFRDYDERKDWMQPFIGAMMIWYEDKLRRDVGLPRLLPDELVALKYRAFANMVVNGAVTPLHEWEKTWADVRH